MRVVYGGVMVHATEGSLNPLPFQLTDGRTQDTMKAVALADNSLAPGIMAAGAIDVGKNWQKTLSSNRSILLAARGS